MLDLIHWYYSVGMVLSLQHLLFKKAKEDQKQKQKKHNSRTHAHEKRRQTRKVEHFLLPVRGERHVHVLRFAKPGLTTPLLGVRARVENVNESLPSLLKKKKAAAPRKSTQDRESERRERDGEGTKGTPRRESEADGGEGQEQEGRESASDINKTCFATVEMKRVLTGV